MTKRWSSTRSDLSLTKRAASKRARRAARGIPLIESATVEEGVVEFWLGGICVGRIVNIGGEVESDDAG